MILDKAGRSKVGSSLTALTTPSHTEGRLGCSDLYHIPPLVPRGRARRGPGEPPRAVLAWQIYVWASDPVSAAIERHRQAWEAYDAACKAANDL
jgi:hypothetical protein